jgi:hypothetical protein
MRAVLTALSTALLLALASCSDAAEPAGSAPDAGGSSSSGALAGDAGADAPAVEDDPAERQPETGFVTHVESFTPGACAGFNADKMPGVVFGAPRGAGAQSGGLDVVSLGTGGSIVLSFDPVSIVDGAGPDFTVFENAFFASGNPNRPFQEPAEVSISVDGETWLTFPCLVDGGMAAGCAGMTPVYSTPGNEISPTDPAVSGGDSFDIGQLGATSVRYVRIHDVGTAACSGAGGPGSNGFDLDAIAVIHAALP